MDYTSAGNPSGNTADGATCPMTTLIPAARTDRATRRNQARSMIAALSVVLETEASEDSDDDFPPVMSSPTTKADGRKPTPQPNWRPALAQSRRILRKKTSRRGYSA